MPATERQIVLRFRGPLTAIMAFAGLSGCGAMLGSDGFNDADAVDRAPDEQVMARIMEGLGGVDTNREPIDYKPRSPLAMPPKEGNLPPPESGDGAAANTGAWPENPEDIDRRRHEEATLREMKRLESDKNYRLTKDELEAGRIPGRRSRDPMNYNQRLREDTGKLERLSSNELSSQRVNARGTQKSPQRVMTYSERLDADTARPRRLTPAEMQGKRVATQESITYEPGEVPPRRYLVDPPTKYREPSPNAPVTPPKKTGLNKWIGDLF